MKAKIISCIGDSLTEGDYGVLNKRCIPNVQKENYPYFLSLLTKAKVNNFGFCGHQSIHILEKYKEGLIDVTNSDIVIIMLGTNGGQTEGGNSENDKAYIEIINLVKKQAPKAKIYLCTPPHATENPSKSNYGYEPGVIQACKFVKKMAMKLSLPIIDIHDNDSFSGKNEDIMQPNDGLHLSKIGYQTLAEIIFKEIKNN